MHQSVEREAFDSLHRFHPVFMICIHCGAHHHQVKDEFELCPVKLPLVNTRDHLTRCMELTDRLEAHKDYYERGC